MIDEHFYLSRLQIRELPPVNKTGLAQLQKAHLLHVPFENLSIHYGQPIDLNLERLFHKVVKQGRGGFCYELNFLYQALLERLGFETQLLSGRVYSSKKQAYGPDFDHMTVLVYLPEGPYISDVGFGEFPFDPVPFELNTVHDLARGQFQVAPYDGTYYRLSKISENEVYPQYLFDNKPRRIAEFRDMCHYHQTSPESSFTQQKFISMPTENGRITLSGNKWKIHHHDGAVTEETLQETFDAAAKRQFGIELPRQFF
jgi:N-hydroxyarylamine O-acetyltransferase